MTIRLEPKLPGEKRDYRHDWSRFLGDDTILSQETTSDDVTISGELIDSETEQAVEWTVEGGALGAVAVITQTITTVGGNTETEIFTLPIVADEPVSLAEAKRQVAMADDDSQDDFIYSLIAPARAYVERVGRYSLAVRQRTETFSRWGDFLEIWRRPVASIDSLDYTDEAGTAAEYTGFLADLNRFPVRVYPGANDSFPGMAAGGAITVTYTTGTIDPLSEEFEIARRAMLLLIGHWFENRETVVVGNASSQVAFAVKSLLDELRPVAAY